MRKTSHTRSMLRRALHYRNLDGAFTRAMETLTGGAFLVGFALMLGASDLEVGLIAAVPFIAQIMNVPAVWILEKVRRRKLLCTVSSLVSRSLWVPIAAAPFLLGTKAALVILMDLLAFGAIFGTLAGLAWNSWMKDLLPGQLRGRFFSSRLWVMGLVGMVLSLVGALVVDLWGAALAGEFVEAPFTGVGLFATEERSPLPLSALFVAGGAMGLMGLLFLNRIPEPEMGQHEGFSMRSALGEPFRDRRFRRLVGFTGSWAFASNFALPFIAVYMLKTLGFPFSYVMGFSIASQLFHLAFLNAWGRLSDRFGNKAVLIVCAPVFSLSLLLWTLTVGEYPWFTLPLIGLIHVMNGMATAGIDVANTSLLYHMAPHRFSAAYFAAATLVTSLAAGIAPILGGALGNFFSDRALTLVWGGLGRPLEQHVVVLQFAHLDFVFLTAFLLGLFALDRLVRVGERPQEASHAVVIKSLKQEIQNTATIRGMRYLTQPASYFAGLILESGAAVGRSAVARARLFEEESDTDS